MARLCILVRACRTRPLLRHATKAETARENLRYHARLHGINDAAARIEALLEQTGLSGRGDERVFGYSRGMLQRLAICRALLQKPDWVFLDEATSALDEPSEQRAYTVLREALPQSAIVSIAHRPAVAAFHEQRIRMEPEGDHMRLATS